MKNMKASKMFETFMIWLLCFLLVVNTLVIFKIYDIYLKIGGNFVSKNGFLTLVTRLSLSLDDLKSLEVFALIYRTFLILLIVVFSIFLIYRLINARYEKLFTLSNVFVGIVCIYSFYYVYITKEVFYTIKIITNKTYMGSLQNILYLLGKMEKLFIIRKVLLVVSILVFVYIILAVVFTLIEVLANKTTTRYTLNSTVLSQSILILIGLAIYGRYLVIESKVFDPLRYLTVNYVENKGEIYLNTSVNLRKINRKTIDPTQRLFYQNGINFEIENQTTPLKENEIRNIKISYNVEDAKEIGLTKVGKLETQLKIDKVPTILKDVSLLDKNSLVEYLSKNDIRYYRKREIIGIYANNDEYFLVQKLKYLDLNITEIKDDFDESSDFYKVIYLGKIFVIDNKVVGISSLNSDYSLIFSNLEELKERFEKNNIVKID